MFVHFHLFRFSPPCSAIFIRLNLFSDPQVVDTRARSSESQSDSPMKEIGQVLTKQVLSPAFASLLESGCRNGCGMRSWGPGLLFKSYFTLGEVTLSLVLCRLRKRVHGVAASCWGAEDKPPNGKWRVVTLLTFHSATCQKGSGCGSFGSGNLGYPNLRLEYTNVTFAQFFAPICSLLIRVAESQFADFRQSELTDFTKTWFWADFKTHCFYLCVSRQQTHFLRLSCSEQLESLVACNAQFFFYL